MLCYAVLCYAMLCYAMLCYAIPRNYFYDNIITFVHVLNIVLHLVYLF